MPHTTRSRSPAIGAKDPPTYEGYETLQRIGIGAASVIYSVKRKGTEEIFALKHVVRAEGEDKRMIEQVVR